MEATHETALCVSGAANQRVTSVRADVLESLDLCFAFANHDDRLVDNRVFHKVADIGDFFQPACHLPGTGPQVLLFPFEEFRVVITLGGNPLEILDRKGHRRADMLTRAAGLR